MRPLLNHLDAPVRFLIFTIPETACLLGPFAWGVMVDAFWCGFVTSIVLYMGISKLQKVIGVRKVRSFYYWYFPTRVKVYKYPIASCNREFMSCVLLMILPGCQSVYNEYFDCPQEPCALCQSLEETYRLRGKSGETAKYVHYAYSHHGHVMQGSVAVQKGGHG